MSKKRHQPRTPDRKPRILAASSLMERVEDKVRKEASKYGCSQSWVIASIVTAYFNLDMPSYTDRKKKRGK